MLNAECDEIQGKTGTYLLQEPLQRFIRNLTPDLALLAHPDEHVFDRSCKLRPCEGYARYCSVQLVLIPVLMVKPRLSQSPCGPVQSRVPDLHRSRASTDNMAEIIFRFISACCCCRCSAAARSSSLGPPWPAPPPPPLVGPPAGVKPSGSWKPDIVSLQYSVLQR